VIERLQVRSVLEGHFAQPATADDVVLDRPAGATPEDVFSLVYRQMRKLAGHRDFEELVQAAAEQAIRSLPAFRGKSSLSTWTFRICYLTVRKHDRWYRRWLRRFARSGWAACAARWTAFRPSDAPLGRAQGARTDADG
jgi:hypothetical protein